MKHHTTGGGSSLTPRRLSTNEQDKKILLEFILCQLTTYRGGLSSYVKDLDEMIIEKRPSSRVDDTDPSLSSTLSILETLKRSLIQKTIHTSLCGTLPSDSSQHLFHKVYEKVSGMKKVYANTLSTTVSDNIKLYNGLDMWIMSALVDDDKGMYETTPVHAQDDTLKYLFKQSKQTCEMIESEFNMLCSKMDLWGESVSMTQIPHKETISRLMGYGDMYKRMNDMLCSNNVSLFGKMMALLVLGPILDNQRLLMRKVFNDTIALTKLSDDYLDVSQRNMTRSLGMNEMDMVAGRLMPYLLVDDPTTRDYTTPVRFVRQGDGITYKVRRTGESDHAIAHRAKRAVGMCSSFFLNIVKAQLDIRGFESRITKYSTYFDSQIGTPVIESIFVPESVITDDDDDDEAHRQLVHEKVKGMTCPLPISVHEQKYRLIPSTLNKHVSNSEALTNFDAYLCSKKMDHIDAVTNMCVSLFNHKDEQLKKIGSELEEECRRLELMGTLDARNAEYYSFVLACSSVCELLSQRETEEYAMKTCFTSSASTLHELLWLLSFCGHVSFSEREAMFHTEESSTGR